jgi:hypothetical protein
MYEYIEAQWDSAVGIPIAYGLDDRGLEFQSKQGKELSLLHSVKTGSETHPVSYPVGTGDFFLGDKVARACRRLLTSN